MASTPTRGASEPALSSYDTDAIKSIAQNGVTTSWTLDQAQRRSLETTGSKTTARHYADTGDNPAYVDVTESGVVTRTRYGSSLGRDLGLTISADGTTNTAQVTLADPHGDVVATSDVTGTSTPAIGIAGWSDQDEYGNPLPAGSAATLTKGVGYGWVGAKQRATLDTGLLLMGARIYDPATGGFTSTDPVSGGNDTTYAYPSDPMRTYDASGLARHIYEDGLPEFKPIPPPGAPTLSDYDWDQYKRMKEGKKADKKAAKRADKTINTTWKKYAGAHGKKQRGQPNKKGGGRAKRVVGAIGAGVVTVWAIAKFASPACGPFAPICFALG